MFMARSENATDTAARLMSQFLKDTGKILWKSFVAAWSLAWWMILVVCAGAFIRLSIWAFRFGWGIW